MYSGFVRAVDRLPRRDRERIVRAVRSLGANPRPQGCKKLANVGNAWRVRVGDYRVVYEIHDRVLLVVVLKVGHRRDVYE
ncbi:MAG: type II toxin-antitoxin system RelE/ParE family toxin [Mycobacteriaceae bacterium]|nr:type II toxin-antitoxin system RelE/ParE family toxin [Mycobacteriaceae bacterium]